MLGIIHIPLAQAQDAPLRLEAGDPPVASLITVSPPDDNGLVTITGVAGSVFPNAHVAIRNLYTEQTVYVPAGVMGTFSARIYGEGNTPFLISPSSTSTPAEDRGIPGSLPGGEATIVYGDFPSVTPSLSNITRVAIDGRLTDWDAYREAQLTENVYALRNSEALFIGVEDALLGEGFEALRVNFTVNMANYSVLVGFAPRASHIAVFTRTNPNATILDPLVVSSAFVRENGMAEVRIPLSAFERINTFQLDGVTLLGATQTVLATFDLTETEAPSLDTVDGVFRAAGSQIMNSTAFTLGGTLAGGSSFWSANGRASGTALNVGDTWRVELDTHLRYFNPSIDGLKGRFGLQPIMQIGADGRAIYPTDTLTNNGWSSTLVNGLPVDNLTSFIPLGEVTIPSGAITRRTGEMFAAIDFAYTIPDDLPHGLYVPVFEGAASSAGQIVTWEQINFGNRNRISRVSMTRLPFVLNIGAVETARLPLALFHDISSDGARGVVAQEDANWFGLSNRVKFNSPTIILPPISDGLITAPGGNATYSLEPYVMNIMPNAYDSSAAPLIPFDLGVDSGAVMTVIVTKPDGTQDDFGTLPILEAKLSTDAQDERSIFGAQTPIDVYRLTTLNRALDQYVFEQYGQYTIELTISAADIWGNQYTGGGTYRIMVAEEIDLAPFVLSGTPFEVGDVFNFGAHIAPSVAAEVSASITLYPLSGTASITRVVRGRANAEGYFSPREQGFTMTSPGMYVVDYEARYTDHLGRLWAASQRGVGLVATPNGSLIAHGQRGIAEANAPRLAWFNARSYNGRAYDPVTLNFPYHSGDVVWLEDDQRAVLQPTIRVQDVNGNYAAWLLTNAAETGQLNARLPNGMDAQTAIARDEIPLDLDLSGNGYSVISAVRPGIAVRQMILGGETGGLPLWWDGDDPYNQQIGAGITGDRPNDYTFLFGGAVVQNDAAGINEAAIYGALAVVIDDTDSRGARVFSPLNGSASAGDGGALLSMSGRGFDLFFVPTGVLPGSVLTVGDKFSIVGQVAPTLGANVDITVTSPSGEIRTINGRANAIGHFYAPEFDFTADETGVWTVDITVYHDGLTSGGVAEAPYPTGGVLRMQGTSYNVYVVPPNADLLDANIQLADTLISVGVPYNFSFSVPLTWTNTRAYYTVMTPSYIVEDSPFNISGRSFSYQLTPAMLRGMFPNIENEPRAIGNAVVDPITLTFVLTGLDETGEQQIQVRRFTLFYNRLMQLNVSGGGS